jgi:hypothetical protein
VRSRLTLVAGVVAVLAVAVLVVLGAFKVADRVADETIERVPIPRTTPTPRATAPPVVVTPAPTPAPGVELVITAPMPHPERQAAAAVVLADGRVLIVGGRPGIFFGRAVVQSDAFGTSAIDSAVLYDPRTDTWTEVQAPANPRWGAVMVLAGDGRPILWGGIGRTEFGSGFIGQTSHQQFDWLTDQWNSIRGPTFSSTVQLLESNTRVYAINRNDLYQFNPTETAWTLVEEGPTARTAFGGVALADGRIVMFVQDERLPSGGFRSGGATLVQEADPSRFQYVVADPRQQGRSAVRAVEGPPYRPQIYALADGSLLLFGGFAEDPAEWERAMLSGIALPGPVFDAATGEQLGSPSATPTATPPPRPAANTALFRLDVDSGVVTELEVRNGDPAGTFRLDGQLYTLALPSMPVTPEGAERLYDALEGRSGAVVLPLDESRVLIAGGANPTEAAIEVVEELNSRFTQVWCSAARPSVGDDRGPERWRPWRGAERVSASPTDRSRLRAWSTWDGPTARSQESSASRSMARSITSLSSSDVSGSSAARTSACGTQRNTAVDCASGSDGCCRRWGRWQQAQAWWRFLGSSRCRSPSCAPTLLRRRMVPSPSALCRSSPPGDARPCAHLARRHAAAGRSCARHRRGRSGPRGWPVHTAAQRGDLRPRD